jgi:transketolase
LGAAEGLVQGAYVLWESGGAGAADSPARSAGGAGDGASGSPGDAGESAGGAGVGASGQPAPQLILIATGSEVAPTLAAARELAQAGTHVRVVSMPCMELFEAQSAEYRDSVIPRHVLRMAVEAGVSMSWWKWVGDAGEVVGIDRFGASAPGATVLEKLGFTADSIAEKARALLGR